MSGPAASAAGSRFQAFMNHPAGMTRPFCLGGALVADASKASVACQCRAEALFCWLDLTYLSFFYF